MTREEALEFFKGVILTFDMYYKYKFTYSGEKEGKRVMVTYGGDSSEIYRTEFGPTEIFSLYDGENNDSWYYKDFGDYVQFIEEV